MALELQIKPCWEAICDQCGDGDSEYGTSYHYPDRQTMVESLESSDWIVRDDGTALCSGCIDELAEGVQCPKCEAPIGERCADPHGGRALALCDERIDLAVDGVVKRREADRG